MKTEIGMRYLHAKTDKVYWVSNIAVDASDGADGDIVTYHRRNDAFTYTYHRKRSEFEDGRFVPMLELHPLDTCAITWNIKDVQEMDAELDTEQAREVLRLLEKKHDANEGINWDVITCAVQTLFKGVI